MLDEGLLQVEDRVRLQVNALADDRNPFPVLGWVSLTEIMKVRDRLGLPIERDLHFVADRPISAYADDARPKGRIVA
jgi:hypothetical protein